MPRPRPDPQRIRVIRFVLRRVAYGALVLLGVNLLTFVLFFGSSEFRVGYRA